MKFKFLLALAVLILSFTNSNANQINVEVNVSIDEANITRFSKRIPVKITITNTGKETLRTKNLKYLILYLSRCSMPEDCGTRGDVYYAFHGIPEKELNKGEFMEFGVSLNDLYWNDAISSQIDSKYPKNLSTVPVTNKFFHASVQIPDGYSDVENSNLKIPLVKNFVSNEILIKPI